MSERKGWKLNEKSDLFTVKWEKFWWGMAS